MKNSGWFPCPVLCTLVLAMFVAVAMGAHKSGEFAQLLRKLATPTPLRTPTPLVIDGLQLVS